MKFGNSGTITTRPLNRLYPLEVRKPSRDNHSHDEITVDQENSANKNETTRPQRKARIIGEMKRRNMDIE